MSSPPFPCLIVCQFTCFACPVRHLLPFSSSKPFGVRARPACCDFSCQLIHGVLGLLLSAVLVRFVLLSFLFSGLLAFFVFARFFFLAFVPCCCASLSLLFLPHLPRHCGSSSSTALRIPAEHFWKRVWVGFLLSRDTRVAGA